MPFSQTLCNDYQIDNKGLVLLCFEGEKKLSTAIIFLKIHFGHQIIAGYIIQQQQHSIQRAIDPKKIISLSISTQCV